MKREKQYIAKHLPRAKAGDPIALHNVAAAYRILSKYAAAYRWWKKGADAGDGSDSLEVGYCLHHGVGVRKDLASAARAYEIAMVSDRATPMDREEAMYLRAVVLLSSGLSGDRKRAMSLLRRANADNDYPQAADLLAAKEIAVDSICTCRRELRPSLATRQCRIHGRRKRWSRASRSSRQCVSDTSEPAMMMRASLPESLALLKGGCGVVSAWLGLRQFRKRVAVAALAKLCKHSPRDGSFAICVAVALKRCGLKIAFHSEDDDDKQPLEVAAYRSAARLRIPIAKALKLSEVTALIQQGKFVILLFDTSDGTGHFSPVRFVRNGMIFFQYSDEPILSLRTFQKRWSAPGICRQAIVVG